MTDPIPPDFLALSDLRGKITLPDPVTGQPVVHVYQRTSAHLANAATEQHPRLQLRREPGGRKGNTPKQQQQRAALRAASQSWQTLSPAEQRQYNNEAKRYGGKMKGYHLYMREQMRDDQ